MILAEEFSFRYVTYEQSLGIFAFNVWFMAERHVLLDTRSVQKALGNILMNLALYVWPKDKFKECFAFKVSFMAEEFVNTRPKQTFLLSFRCVTYRQILRMFCFQSIIYGGRVCEY